MDAKIKGTYNYKDVSSSLIGHIVEDIKPYYEKGSFREADKRELAKLQRSSALDNDKSISSNINERDFESNKASVLGAFGAWVSGSFSFKNIIKEEIPKFVSKSLENTNSFRDTQKKDLNESYKNNNFLYKKY